MNCSIKNILVDIRRGGNGGAIGFHRDGAEDNQAMRRLTVALTDNMAPTVFPASCPRYDVPGVWTCSDDLDDETATRPPPTILHVGTASYFESTACHREPSASQRAGAFFLVVTFEWAHHDAQQKPMEWLYLEEKCVSQYASM